MHAYVREQILKTAEYKMQDLYCKVNEKMAEIDQHSREFEWAYQQSYPPDVGMVAEYLCVLFDGDVDNESIQKYQQLFGPPGNMFVNLDMQKMNRSTIKNSNRMSTTMMYVDWELAFPSIGIECFNCKDRMSKKQERHFLARETTNFAKSKSLFSIWTQSGNDTWCIVMNYHCSFCDFRCAGNEGKLLSFLPREIAAAYPVIPQDAYGSGVHLHKDIGSDYFEFGDSEFSQIFDAPQQNDRSTSGRNMAAITARATCTTASVDCTTTDVSRPTITQGSILISESISNTNERKHPDKTIKKSPPNHGPTRATVASTTVITPDPLPYWTPTFVAPWSPEYSQWYSQRCSFSNIPDCGWLPRPDDCCFAIGGKKCFCAAFAAYRHLQSTAVAGAKKIGKPPHDATCPTRQGYPCWHGPYVPALTGSSIRLVKNSRPMSPTHTPVKKAKKENSR